MSKILRSLVPAALWVSALAGQTQVDLRTQSKAVDFSAAVSTKPARTGSTLPSTCTLWEAFIKTDAASGEGLYWCTAANTWTRQSPNAVDRTQATSFASGVRQTFSPSTGVAGIRVTPGLLPETALAGDLAVDATDYYKLKVYDGSQWTASSGTSGGDTITPGLGIVVSGSTPKQVSVDTAVVPAMLTVSATADFPSIDAASCQAVSVPLTGAAVGDAVAAGWPVLQDGLIGMAQVIASNAVSLRLCNVSSSAIDPPNQVYRATIVRSF
jgi:hypothetical protein